MSRLKEHYIKPKTKQNENSLVKKDETTKHKDGINANFVCLWKTQFCLFCTQSNFYAHLDKHFTEHSGRSRISQMGEGTIPKDGGTNLLFGQKCPQKCMTIKEIGWWRERASIAPPPSRDSPMDPFIKCSIFGVNSTQDYQNRCLVRFRFSSASHMTSPDFELHAPVEKKFLELCRYL